MPADLPIPTTFGGPGRWALSIIAGTLGVLFVWGGVAPLNSGAIAPGEIISAGRSRIVQHLEGGIIRAIHVKDGDKVAAGQELVTLADIEGGAQAAIASAEEAALAALVDRLAAESENRARLPPMPRGSPSIEIQTRLFESRRLALQKELAGVEQRAADARKELAGWEAKDIQLRVRAANAEEESRINQGLYEKEFISKPRLLELDSRKAETAASIAENAAEVARARQKITDAETLIAKLKNDWASSVLEELRRAQEAHATAREKLVVARDRLQRTRILAPHHGTIHSLRFTTLGGIVPPGGVVLEVTPEAEQLVVEAHLSPDDIDMVRVGLPARVRLTAYKARRHFTLKAVVTQVSSDVFHDDKTGRSYYKVRVEIPDEELRNTDRMVLVPGMLAQAEIVTGERTALRYLLDPMIDSFHRGMKEK